MIWFESMGTPVVIFSMIVLTSWSDWLDMIFFLWVLVGFYLSIKTGQSYESRHLFNKSQSQKINREILEINPEDI